MKKELTVHEFIKQIQADGFRQALDRKTREQEARNKNRPRNFR